jgi:transglutaminase/protease-like cytokinesis protein 3
MKKSAKIYAVLIALALLFTAGCVRKTADSDNVESSNELPSFISETTTTANDEVSTEKETGTTAQTTQQTTPARENVTTHATEPETTPATQTETKGQENVPATKPAAHDTSAYPAYSSSNNYSELTKSYSNVTEDDINTINSILNSIIKPGMTETEKIRTVHNWIVCNTTYNDNYYDRGDSFNHVSNLLNNKTGVCQGYSVTFYIFMKQMGIPCTLVMGKTDNVSHAWNAVKLDGNWYYIDVTWDDPVVNGTSNYPGGDNISYEYLLCTYNHISMTHTEDNYIGTTPLPNGISNDYNDLMYRMSGFTNVMRVNSSEELADRLQGFMNKSGKYAIILENEKITMNDGVNVVKNYLKNLNRGYSVSISYSTNLLAVTVDFT